MRGNSWVQYTGQYRSRRQLFSAARYPAFFIVSGLQDVMPRWLEERAVEIAIIPGAEKVYRREERVGDFKILYP